MSLQTIITNFGNKLSKTDKKGLEKLGQAYGMLLTTLPAAMMNLVKPNGNYSTETLCDAIVADCINSKLGDADLVNFVRDEIKGWTRPSHRNDLIEILRWKIPELNMKTERDIIPPETPATTDNMPAMPEFSGTANVSSETNKPAETHKNANGTDELEHQSTQPPSDSVQSSESEPDIAEGNHSRQSANPVEPSQSIDMDNMDEQPKTKVGPDISEPEANDNPDSRDTQAEQPAQATPAPTLYTSRSGNNGRSQNRDRRIVRPHNQSIARSPVQIGSTEQGAATVTPTGREELTPATGDTFGISDEPPTDTTVNDPARTVPAREDTVEEPETQTTPTATYSKPPRMGADLMGDSTWDDAVVTAFGFPFINYGARDIKNLLGSDEIARKRAYSNIKGQLREVASLKTNGIIGSVWDSIASSPIKLLKLLKNSPYSPCFLNLLVVDGHSIRDTVNGGMVSARPVIHGDVKNRLRKPEDIPVDFVNKFFVELNPERHPREYYRYSGIPGGPYLDDDGVPVRSILSANKIKPTIFMRSDLTTGSFLSMITGLRKSNSLIACTVDGHRGGFIVPSAMADTLFTY